MADVQSFDLELDRETNDLKLYDNDVHLVTDETRIAQQILITLKFWLGEWFLAVDEGIPYLEYVLIKDPNFSHIRQILTTAIMQVDGVANVPYMDVSLDNETRILTVEYQAETIIGLIDAKEGLSIER